MLKNCHETIGMMRQKEAEFVAEAKDRYQQVLDRYEKLKAIQGEHQAEKDRLRKEAESLRELIRMKDQQMEEWLTAEERDKQLLERVSRENKDLKGQMTKREFEMKDLAKMAKMQLEENMRLKRDNEKLAKENDLLVGHKNPSQKIQHHVRIKEENNRLREENLVL